MQQSHKTKVLSIVFGLLIVSALAPLYLYAAPTISGLSGAISNGSTVTISSGGNDFGTGPTVHKWDQFEQSGGDYDAGDPIADGWGFRSPGTTPAYNTDSTRTGSTKHILCNHTAASAFYYLHGSALTEMYVSWWVRYYFDGISGWGTWGATQNYKFLEITHDAPGQADTLPQFTMLYYPSAGANILGDDADYVYWNSTEIITDGFSYKPNTEVWARYEVYFKESSPFDGTQNGTVEVWVQVGDSNSFHKEVDYVANTATNNSGGTDHMQCIAFDSFMRDAPATGLIRYDDVYIASSQARVEIGDNATWANCTHREIQIPTAWAAGEITATVNLGSFESGTAYLFVVDSDGTASTGYEVTIGGSSPSTPSLRGVSLHGVDMR